MAIASLRKGVHMISAVRESQLLRAMDLDQLLAIYRVMLTARRIDKLAQELTSRGEAFFHLSGAGHEGTAILASLLHDEDWLLCHYRDKALMIARGIKPRVFFDGLYGKQESQTRGRRISAFAFSDTKLNIMSSPTLVSNAALHTVGVASVVKPHITRPLVLHSMGEGATQEGEFFEACAEAVRGQLPILFLIQDNHLAISTRTEGQTFYSRPDGEADSFYGMPITRIDGRHVVTAWQQMRDVVTEIRQNRRPQIVIFDVERLCSHTHADDETIYRDTEELQRISETSDPIQNLEQHLLASHCGESMLESIRREVEVEVAEAEAAAYAGPDPVPVSDAKRPIQVELTHPSRERPGGADGPQLTMREALRDVLQHQLTTNPDVVLLGEDIEDPKGDVFGVTRGLSTQFPTRVRNSPLSESTIVGIEHWPGIDGQASRGVHSIRGLSPRRLQSNCQ